jgi:hypothetical protein
MIANVMVYLTRLSGASQNIDENAIRYMVLNSIRLLRSKFKESYGEMIICCDSNDVWRKDIFPHYKANRKKMRETSTVDWTSLFNVLGTIRDELGEHMPYKILQIPRAEADDVIASLCHEYGKTMRNVGENIMIVSGDKDFAQLQKYANVYQYAPVQKKNISVDNPERFLREHIMLGDRGDGVPNFLSDDDTFISDKRQKPVMRKKLEEWSILDPTLFCDDEMLRNYKRNEELINLDKIPKAIQQEVITQFATQTPSPRSKILNYFIRYRLGNLTEHIGEF